MVELLRAIFLSFCPERMRRSSHSLDESQFLRVAVVTGVIQAILSCRLLWLGFLKYFSAQTHQWGYHFIGDHYAVQAIGFYMIIAQYLLHPLSIVLAYLAVEGGVRILGGLLVSQVIPSLPVVLMVKLWARIHRKEPIPLPDSVDVRRRQGVVIISSAMPKDTWNPSLVLSIKGPELQEGWYELERKYLAAPPRPYVYVFHQALSAEVLRGYEEYDTTGLEQ